MAFDRLSDTSRRLRFFRAKSSLTEEELRYLTELDQDQHLAIVAMRVDELGRETGIGIARYVRLEDEPEIAEAAVTVADEAQSKGVGRALIERLAAAAKERGIHSFVAETLEENKAVIGMLRAAEPAISLSVEPSEQDPAIVRLILRIPTECEERNDASSLIETLARVARGEIEIPEPFALLKTRYARLQRKSDSPPDL